MELFLNSDLVKAEGLKDCDIDWLRHIWLAAKDTSGSYAKIFMDALPEALRETWIYKNFYMRLVYYRDTEKFIVDFEEVEDEKEYYIHLSDNFTDLVNYYIRTEFSDCGFEYLKPYSKVDPLEQETYQELSTKLGEILNVLSSSLQLSSANAANIKEAKTIIVEIQENLKTGSAQKGSIRKMVANALSAVEACNQIKEFTQFVVPLLRTLLQLLQ